MGLKTSCLIKCRLLWVKDCVSEVNGFKVGLGVLINDAEVVLDVRDYNSTPPPRRFRF